MIRRRNKRHVADEKEDKKYFSYSCVCGAKGWNSLWFPNRRMINVAPFTELEISFEEEAQEGKRGKWILDLKCDKKALLQLTRYNDTFALQRLRGIRELRELVKKQKSLPDIYVRAFLTNNPVAVKVKILEKFAASSDKATNINIISGALVRKLEYVDADKKFSGKSSVAFSDLRDKSTRSQYVEEFYKMLDERLRKKAEESGEKEAQEGMNWTPEESTESLMRQSLDFYLYLLVLGRAACKKKLGLSTESREQYEEELSAYCEQLAKEAARVWNIRDKNMIALMADCFVLMHCDFSTEESFWDDDTYRYQVHYPLRGDICEVVQSYTEDRDYLSICETGKREKDTGEWIFDFYSDYFLYFTMDICTD